MNIIMIGKQINVTFLLKVVIFYICFDTETNE